MRSRHWHKAMIQDTITQNGSPDQGSVPAILSGETSSIKVADLEVAVPDRRAKGFIRRQRRALELRDEIASGGYTIGTLDRLVEFILDFVTSPADRAVARELVFDLSEAEFADILGALSGSDAAPPLANASA